MGKDLTYEIDNSNCKMKQYCEHTRVVPEIRRQVQLVRNLVSYLYKMYSVFSSILLEVKHLKIVEIVTFIHTCHKLKSVEIVTFIHTCHKLKSVEIVTFIHTCHKLKSVEIVTFIHTCHKLKSVEIVTFIRTCHKLKTVGYGKFLREI